MKEIAPIKDIIQSVFEDIANASISENEYNGIPIGLDSLDKKLYGYDKATLNVVASRPSKGKSAFIEGIIRNAVLENDLSVLYFSLELGEKDVLKRLIASETGFSYSLIKTGRLAPEQMEYLHTATLRLNDAKLYIDDSSLDIIELCDRVRSVVEKQKIDAVFVDCLQLIKTKATTAVNREQEISHIARQLKFLSKELNVPIVVTSQLNRRQSFDDQKYRLENLRDSGVIEDIADTIIFINDIEKTDSGDDVEIAVVKNRQGETFDVKMRFDKTAFNFWEFAEPQIGLAKKDYMLSANEFWIDDSF